MNNFKSNIKIKELLFPFLLMMTLFFATSCETDENQEVTTITNLVLAEEFDVEGTLDPTLWTYDIGRGPNDDGWGNQELQYYTDRTENVKVENGFLIISAIEEPFENASPIPLGE